MMKGTRLSQEIRWRLPAAVRRRLPRTVLIIEVSEAESRRLNHRYRRKETPANVLSFRYGPTYGEILICSRVIRREAARRGNSYRLQRDWMILHGVLHLAGFDHEKSAKASKKFLKLEDKLLSYIRKS